MSDNLTDRAFTAVVLAAGEGTRMRSSLPKVLHRIAGRTMLGHVLHALKDAGAQKMSVVAGPGRGDVAQEAKRIAPDVSVAVQTDRLGTAHAVLAARESLSGGEDILVVFADTPLIEAATFGRLRAALEGGAAVAVLGFEAADPTGYGRLITGKDGAVDAIREEKDASPAERAIKLSNAGLMALSGAHALTLLDAVGNKNSKGEYYLTDVVEIARARGLTAVFVLAPEDEVRGVNDRVQLAAAEGIIQTRLRERAMRGGVTLQDPASVYLSADAMIDEDVTIEPHVVIGTGVSIARGAVIHAFSHLEGAKVGPDASVGPFARLRPGAHLGESAKVGNFVEIKASKLGAGAKVSHLSYIGDATIGAKANIGAGTITCNYDGFGKFKTDIGANAFIGSNSSLVAPVRIGEGAYVGSGSVITADVGDGDLAIGRGRQTEKAGWAVAFRAARAKPKD